MAIPFIAWAALAGLNAALAASKSAQQAKQREAEANIRAAEAETAPWTGRAPTTQVSTAPASMWADLAGAGVNTLGQAAALQQAGLFKEAGEAATAAEGAKEATKKAITPVTASVAPTQQSNLLMPQSYQLYGQNSSFLQPWEMAFRRNN